MADELEKTAGTNETDADNAEAEGVVLDAGDDNEEEFSDGEAESGESSNKEGDKEPPKPKTEEGDAKPWKTEKNAEAAAKRREAERKAEIKKARNEAIIETLNGVNPYTSEKIEDDADVEEYLTMREIEKSGKDPVGDYSKFLKDKAKEQQRAEQLKGTQEEWLNKDREAFSAKHPDVKFNELIGDELFKTFAVGKVGRIPMTKIYADYQSFNKLSEERAKSKAAQILANTAATPGKLSNGTPPAQKSVSDMSKTEFEAFVEKVKRGEIK